MAVGVSRSGGGGCNVGVQCLRTRPLDTHCFGGPLQHTPSPSLCPRGLCRSFLHG